MPTKAFKSIKYAKPNDALLPSRKAHYNKLSNIIRLEMKAIQESQWIKSFKETQKHSTDYWRKIKHTITKSSTPSKPKPISTLFHNASVVSTDAMKSHTFGMIPSETFKDTNEPNFDQN